MQGYATSFGLGFVAGMRSMTACAALAWAASKGRTRGSLIPGGAGARAIATTMAFGEMAGDKMPFAPDRRIPPSFAFRLAIGAVGGWGFVGRQSSPKTGALAGMAGAVAGTLIGPAARGPDSRTFPGRMKGFTEDAAAAGLAALVVSTAEEQHAPTVIDPAVRGQYCIDLPR